MSRLSCRFLFVCISVSVSSWQDTYLDTCDTGFWCWLFVPRGNQQSYQEANSDISDRGKNAIRYWRLAIGRWRFYFRLSQGVRSRLILLSRNRGQGTNANGEVILLKSTAGPDFYSTEFYSRARIPTLSRRDRVQDYVRNVS